MKKSLIIVGAGVYGLVAHEIADSVGEYDAIVFVDDFATVAPNGTPVIGAIADLPKLSGRFTHAIVALGRSDLRLKTLQAIRVETALQITSLISPQAFVSPSARIGEGSVIEPMAVVHTGAVLSEGCLVSAGAVVNHFAYLGKGVHIDCNAAVAGNTVVPDGTKVESASLFVGEKLDPAALFAK